MVERLARLEEAERLVIGLLECAGRAIGELKEIQANDTEKNTAFATRTTDYYETLANIKKIILEELDSFKGAEVPSIRRPGIDQLAITEWEAKVIADNLHELITH